MVAEKKSTLQKLRDGPVGKAVEAALEKTDKALGPSGKAWLANGLDELRQAVALGSDQIQPGMSPGVWGTITTGEATAERMAGDHEKQAALRVSYDVPAKTTVGDLARTTEERTPQQEEREHGKDRQQELER